MWTFEAQLKDYRLWLSEHTFENPSPLATITLALNT